MGAHSYSIGEHLAKRLRQTADEIDPAPTALELVTGYTNDILGFCTHVLGQTFWSRQRELVQAIQDHTDVAVTSGHKTGKTRAIICAALWFYCSFPGCRVILTANTDDQLQDVLWNELNLVLRDARERGIPIPGADKISLLARNGLKHPYNFASIKGATAKTPEAVAGRSGERIFYIADEASGIPDYLFDAMEGNRAAGNTTKLVMTSQPTRSEGKFHDAFHAKKAFYYTMQIDSRETPNCTGLEPAIPGLAGPEWVAKKLAEWGEDDPRFAVRVKGSFIASETGKLFSLSVLAESAMRYAATEAIGQLRIGFDPAGDSESADRSVFAWRRGKKLIGFKELRGMGADALLAHALSLIIELKQEKEIPTICIDSEGEIGAKVYPVFRAHANANPTSFKLVRVRSSEAAIYEPHVYDRVRDEIWMSGKAWVRSGGALPAHEQLQTELHVAELEQDQRRVKVMNKKEMRKRLGYSPDIADAVLLSLWEPRGLLPEKPKKPDSPATVYEQATTPTLDPYASQDPWRR